MSDEPIYRLLDAVDWIPTQWETSVSGSEELPFETHRGTLKIAGLEIEVVQLSNGKRLITEQGLAKFIEFLHGVKP